MQSKMYLYMLMYLIIQILIPFTLFIKMAMLSSWISKGAQAISNSAKSMAQINNTGPDSNLLVKEFLNKMEAKLSKQLGENVEGSFQSTKNQVIKQSQLQKSLLQTKQKLNSLLSQSQSRTQCIKQMVHSFLQTLTSIGKVLNNEDLLTPLKDIEAAFMSYNKGKIQKQLKYFSKLYEAALQDYLRSRMGKLEEDRKDQVSLFKNLNKNLEVELFRSRNTAVELQKRLAEANSKTHQLTQKITILQKLGSESLLQSSAKQKQKQLQKQKQVLQKLKLAQRQKMHLQRSNKQYQNQLLKITAANQVIKNNQEKVIEEMMRDAKKKEVGFQGLVHKMCADKLALEEKIKELNMTVETVREQLNQAKRRQVLQKKDSNPPQLKNLQQQIKQLNNELKSAKNEMQSLISKQIMKGLFTKFEDQSKQWSVRKDIKNQIYLLLDIKPKEPVKSEEKKWFGIF